MRIAWRNEAAVNRNSNVIGWHSCSGLAASIGSLEALAARGGLGASGKPHRQVAPVPARGTAGSIGPADLFRAATSRRYGLYGSRLAPADDGGMIVLASPLAAVGASEANC